ncbi:uncharacterized protein [Rutidosis leptorrhynchoides]|uniref:uncharacterized protein n=1 Tax=Rutidosis leptorrhynchoides TaxID=125765 RepID=UPI003A999C91
MAKDDDDVSGRGTTHISKLDFGDPLYLHPSDISSAPLINVKLKGTENYKSWSCAIELALQTKNKMGFINGTFKRSEDNEVLGIQWDRCNAVVLSWILSSIFLAVNLHHQMGLDDVYQPIRSNILTRDPLPSVNTAFAIISREESHKKSNMSGKKSSESSAFYSNSFKPSFNSQPKDLKCVKCGRTNHTVDKCFKVVGYPTRTGNLKCTKCGMTNHTVDRCFKVVGYPNNLKRKGFGSNNNIKGNSSKSNCENQGSSSSTPESLSNEQVMRLLSLLDEKGGVKPGVSSMSGNFANFNIVDSGANQHMTNSVKNFVSYIDVSDLNLTVSHPNGTKAKVSKIENLKISNNVVLQDVLVVLDYCVSLLSVYCLVRDSKLFVGFDESACYIQDLVSKKTLVTGSQCGGLYYLTGNEKGIVGSSNISKINNNSIDLWHCRLGHPAEQALLCLKDSLKLNDKILNGPCDVCHKAKQTRESFQNSVHKTTELGELVHLDVWGPYKVQSHKGFKYFLKVVDDFARGVWVYLLKTKEEVAECLKNLFHLLKNQFNKTVKCFRSDNGTEFINSRVSEFVQNNGIIHQTSCAYTPQQNGLGERKHRHLFNVARALMFQGRIPLRFWDECILTAVYLINRTPTSLLNGKCPFELIYKRILNLSHLRVFGCLAFSTILNNKDKFSERSEKCVFLGYSSVKKGYKLYSLDNKNCFVSRDVNLNDEGEDLDHHSDGSSDPMPVDNSDDSVDTVESEEYGRATSPTTTLNDKIINPEGTVLQNKEGESSTYTFQPSVRKSQRNTSIRKRFNEFVLDGNVKYGIDKFVNYSKLNK